MSALKRQKGHSVIFADLNVKKALGAILAHSQKVGKHTFRKGRTLSAADINDLNNSGIKTVTAIQLEKGDLHENDAAERLARAIAGKNVTPSSTATGRCNLVANANGLVVLDTDAINTLNLKNEVIAISTVLPFNQARKGDVIATVKIITFAVSRNIIEGCEKIILAEGPPVTLSPFTKKKIGLIQTKLPILRNSLLEKARTVTANRAELLDCSLEHEVICNHTTQEVAKALKECAEKNCEITLIMGASAIADRADVIPLAVKKCQGEIEHFGLPVDPGNLMLLASAFDMRVLGLPGSARSPRLHGFDWILQRLVANLKVTGNDLMRMGVGGLLKDIPSRPLPRTVAVKPDTTTDSKLKISAVILGAGQSRRMGSVNKLISEIEGRSMISHIADAAEKSNVDRVFVVTGHEDEEIRRALSNHDINFVHNPNYADGLSTSLRTAIGALDADTDGVVVCLGDMPGITAEHINALINVFNPEAGRQICVPTFNGKWGNPVLWDGRFFAAIQNVSGDVGARHLIGEHQDVLCEVPIEDNAVITDLDTPAALSAHIAGLKKKE